MGAIVLCPYCCRPAALRSTSAHLYYGRDYGPVWQCEPCEAWVGCHKGGHQPLGRLANAALRAAKQRAHAAFDPLWQAKMRQDGCAKNKARSKGYIWLAGQLGIAAQECHIGYFNEDMCARVVEVCQAVRRPSMAAAS